MSKNLKSRLNASVILVVTLVFASCQHNESGNVDPHAGPTMNHHEVNNRLATGGHFVDGGLAAVKEKGVQVVIDLRDEPPAGQKAKLAKLGIEWINVPVKWKAPKQQDFDRFAIAMAEHKNDNVLVQCAANYRASSMTYLYRVAVEKVPEKVAAEDLLAVWEPNEQWREYMDEIIASAP